MAGRCKWWVGWQGDAGRCGGLGGRQVVLPCGSPAEGMACRRWGACDEGGVKPGRTILCDCPARSMP